VLQLRRQPHTDESQLRGPDDILGTHGPAAGLRVVIPRPIEGEDPQGFAAGRENSENSSLTWSDADRAKTISHAVPLDFPRTCCRNQN
jgi:hypothetical protein